MLKLALRDFIYKPWYKAWHEFNFLPSRYVHPSWAPYLFSQEMERLLRLTLSDDSLHRHLSEHILEFLQLPRTPSTDMLDSRLHLAILPQRDFLRLTAFAGSMFHLTDLRQIVRREDVTYLQENISEQVLNFARSCADMPEIALQNVQSGDVVSLVRSIAMCGFETFRIAMSELSEPEIRRVALRLPIDLFNNNLPHCLTLTPDAALERLLNLMKEVDPEWLSCFAMEF